jgi:outer membrane protein assembly factor BamB
MKNKRISLTLTIFALLIIVFVSLYLKKTNQKYAKENNGYKKVEVYKQKPADMYSSDLYLSPWPVFQGTRTHNGRSPFVGPQEKTIKWSHYFNSLLIASPVIGTDGTIYISTYESYLYAVSPNGMIKWRFATRDTIQGSPAIADDGTIYLPSTDHCLYAIWPDGTIKWVFTTNGRNSSSPVIDKDGTIYFGSHDGNIYALNPDGSKEWSLTIGRISASSPAISRDGTIYIGTYKSEVYAISKEGRIKWKYKLDGGIRATPAIGEDGTIYIGTRKGTIYALAPEGRVKWKFHTDGDIRASAAIGKDHTIYIGSWDKYLYALTSIGKLKWKFRTKGVIETSAIVAADETIYFASIGDRIYALNPDGTVKWSGITGMFFTSPVISPEGTLYIGREQRLLAIGKPIPNVDIDINKQGYLTGEVINFRVLINNKATESYMVELKVFVIEPDYQQILLNSSVLNLPPEDTITKELKYTLNKKGRYIFTAKLLDSISGDELIQRKFEFYAK